MWGNGRSVAGACQGACQGACLVGYLARLLLHLTEPTESVPLSPGGMIGTIRGATENGKDVVFRLFVTTE